MADFVDDMVCQRNDGECNGVIDQPFEEDIAPADGSSSDFPFGNKPSHDFVLHHVIVVCDLCLFLRSEVATLRSCWQPSFKKTLPLIVCEEQHELDGKIPRQLIEIERLCGLRVVVALVRTFLGPWKLLRQPFLESLPGLVPVPMFQVLVCSQNDQAEPSGFEHRLPASYGGCRHHPQRF